MTGQPYCGVAPSAAELLSRWNFDPVLLTALVTFAAAHLMVLVREGATMRDAEAKYFAGTWVLLFALFVSPLCALTSALFSVRVIHHVLMIAVIAPFFLLALPERLRAVRLPAGAVGVLAVIHAGVLWYWHAPAPYSQALESYAIFWLMQVSLLVSAVLLWMALLSKATSSGEALLGLLVTVIQMGLLGALLTFAKTPLYVPHFLTTEMWGMSALADQQLAGLVMWIPAAIPYITAALFRFASAIADAEAERAS